MLLILRAKTSLARDLRSRSGMQLLCGLGPYAQTHAQFVVTTYMSLALSIKLIPLAMLIILV